MCVICRGNYSNEKIIHAADCQSIKQLPPVELLPYIEELYCNKTSVAYIPQYPTLKKLVTGVYINELPSFAHLIDLYCGNSNISRLTFMPKLKYLYAAGSKISSIDEKYLPSLQVAYLPNTQLEHIDHKKLKELYCNNTLIKQ